jgi:hypothetical protein
MRLSTRLPLYLLVALIVTVLWGNWAETEAPPKPGMGLRRSIVGIANGTAESPFVQRRLLADSARALAWIVPAQVWQGVTSALDAIPPISDRLRTSWYWTDTRDWPLLISAMFLIFSAVVGFSFAAERLIAYYLPAVQGPSAVGLTCVFTVGLLGGGGDPFHYYWYPYDLPNACLYAFLLIAIELKAWWQLPLFALAAYSKETSAFLILVQLAYAVGGRDRRWDLLHAAAAAVIFVLIQSLILAHYPPMPVEQRLFAAERNTRLLAWHLLFSSWKFAIVLSVLIRLGVLWRRVPAGLRYATVLYPCFFLAGFLGAWIEEFRQYTELWLPTALLLAWITTYDFPAAVRHAR